MLYEETCIELDLVFAESTEMGDVQTRLVSRLEHEEASRAAEQRHLEKMKAESSGDHKDLERIGAQIKVVRHHSVNIEAYHRAIAIAKSASDHQEYLAKFKDHGLGQYIAP